MSNLSEADLDRMLYDEDARAVTYTDAYEIISKKIISAKLTKEFIHTQREFSEKSILIQQNALDVAAKKDVLIDQLIALYTQQLRKFDADRQDACIMIHKEMSDLDYNNTYAKQLITQLKKIDHEMHAISDKISMVEATIPVEQIVTNYTVKQ